uniref:Ubiquitin-like protease family profile domain-containing protein n=1 Tax=Setaria italica TaxID=4555 RepID=K3YD16_SETIT
MKAAENPHHLGVGGYTAKVAKWRREEKERRRAGLPDMFAGLDERSMNWVLARIPTVTTDNKVKFKHRSTTIIYERLEQLAEVQKKGLFRPDKEKDQLTAAIGTVEHSGCVRAMSSTLPWGKAFPNDQANYRKCKRYKKNLDEKMREIANAGSIANMRYPVDNIQVETPYRLVILYGRKQNKFPEVATGMAVTGHVFPKAPPPEYVWVQVVMVLDESCETDIPIDEGIEVFGDVMNQYILWHHRDIVMNASPETSRPSQEVPLPDSNIDTEQPTLSHVQGANNEEEQAMLSPVQEALNEDDGTSALEGDERVDDLEVNNPTSPSSASPPPKRPVVPHMVSTFEKAPSTDIDKFLNVLKKKASSFGEKSVTRSASRQKEKDQNLNFFASDDVSMDYEHGKPFLYRWDLLEGTWELNKLHGWIMNAMKQGIRAITTHVPTKVFLGVLPYQIMIDFEDLHRLYRQQHLDVNLISFWCLMQWREEELMHGGFKICIINLPKLGKVVVLDSSSYHRDRYKDFIGIIQNVYKLYILKGGCHKQPPSFVLCGYYVCEFIRNNGSNYSKIEDKQIDNICMDMTRFILREICHEDGAFFDKDGVLMVDECTNLRRWA